MERRIYKEDVKFFIILFTIIILVELCLNPFFPKLEYFYYKCNAEKYLIVDADVIESREAMIVPGKSGALISRRKNTVQYVINGVEYTERTYAYPDVEEPTRIKIAVKMDNPTDVRRCVEYHWGKDRLFIALEIIVYVVFTGILFLAYYFQHKKEKVYKIKGEYEKSFAGQEAEKQLYILEHMPQCKVTENELQELTEGLVEKGIKFNKGTLWLIMHYGRSREMAVILNLLLLIWEGKYFDYIEKLYEQGLPENYYVLAEQDEKYYCCCEESERLYLFSRGVGITQTKYGMLYDYIMEQMDSKAEE